MTDLEARHILALGLHHYHPPVYEPGCSVWVEPGQTLHIHVGGWNGAAASRAGSGGNGG